MSKDSINDILNDTKTKNPDKIADEIKNTMLQGLNDIEKLPTLEELSALYLDFESVKELEEFVVENQGNAKLKRA
jgi:hypothetical protein